jgi:pimeloyl-ACP methyl ester carboxylesterase
VQPTVRFTKSGDVNIAYGVVGDGPIDLVWVPGWVSNMEISWEDPSYARFLDRLASFSRLIVFDKRGTGLSDRVPYPSCPPSSSAWMTSGRSWMRSARIGPCSSGPRREDR